MSAKISVTASKKETVITELFERVSVKLRGKGAQWNLTVEPRKQGEAA